MHAPRAQTFAQHYISSVGAQTAGPIGTQIDTNTRWGKRQTLWESARGARNRGGAKKKLRNLRQTVSSSVWRTQRAQRTRRCIVRQKQVLEQVI
jgi:hypothetical protein